MNHSFPFIWFDGSYFLSKQVCISPFDRGLTLGDGLFETCLWNGNQVEFLSEHRSRLAHSCEVFEFPPPPNTKKLVDIIQNLVEMNKKGQGFQKTKNFQNKKNSLHSDDNSSQKTKCAIRITLSRGPGKRGLKIDGEEKPWMMITLSDLPEINSALYLALDQKACFGTREFEVRRNRFSLSSFHKTLNYMDSMIVYHKTQKIGLDDLILLDDRGYLACSTLANLFLIKKEVLLTPAKECAILPGIIREKIIQFAKKRKIPVKETRIKPEFLEQVDAVFLTNSLRGVMPVSKIDHFIFDSKQNKIFQNIKHMIAKPN